MLVQDAGAIECHCHDEMLSEMRKCGPNGEPFETINRRPLAVPMQVEKISVAAKN